MSRNRFTSLLAVPSFVVLAALLALLTVMPAAADDTRTVGPYRFTLAFAETPVYAQSPNTIVIRAVDAAGMPVEGLESSLRLRIGVPSQVTETLTLTPASGEPGVYRARILLPKSAVYTMDLIGNVAGQPVSERFVSGENGLERVLAQGRTYPYGSWIIILITLSAYLAGLGWFLVRGLRGWKRRTRRPSAPGV